MPDFGTEVLQFTATGTAAVGQVGDAVEAPSNGEVGDVTVTVGTAPTGAALIADVLVNGTSVFATALGTVANNKTAQQAAGPGWDATSTTLDFTPAQDNVLQAGQVIVVDSEQILVGGVTGDQKVQGSSPEVQLTGCTRGYNGTTAATHTAGTSVTPAKPTVAAGATKSASEDSPLAPLAAASVQIKKGDVITATLTQVGSTVAGTNPEVAVQFIPR